MRRLIIVIWIFCFVGVKAQGAQSCAISPGIPGTTRGDGIAELVTDLYMICEGTPNGAVVTTDIVLTMNAPVTSATPGGFPEVLLLVDEPQPGAQVPGVNLFQASSISGNQVKFLAVPHALPGIGQHRLRFTNIRVNANSLRSVFSRYGPILVNVAMTGFTVTLSETGLAEFFPHTLVTDLWDANAQASGGVALPQCTGQNTDLLASPMASGALSLVVNFQTGIQYGFRIRNAGGPVTLQPQIPPQIYSDLFRNSESGYYAPNLSAANFLNQAGLATQGTRLMVRFSNVPSGISLFVTTTQLLPGLYAARLTQTDLNGAGPYSPVTATGTTTYSGQALGIAPLTVTNGSAQAVWEVTSVPDVRAGDSGSLQFGVLAAYQAGVPQAGTVNVEPLSAPISTVTGPVASPVPRFTGLDVEPQYFAIYSCAAGRPDLTVTAITAPATAFERSSVAVSATVQNLGGPVTGPFRGQWGFYADAQGTQPLIYSSTAICQGSSFGAGNSATCNTNLEAGLEMEMPQAYIGLTIDRFQDVGETNETNNLFVLSTPITVTPCAYTIVSAGSNFSTLGGGGSFNVTTDPGCPRNPTTAAYWITITSPPANGSGVVNYTVSPNGGYTRWDTIELGHGVHWVRYQVRQAAGAGLNEAPHVTGLTPTGGTGNGQTFTASLTDANSGGNDIAIAELLIGATTASAGSCYVRFDPTGNAARLMGDDGLTPSAPLILGGAGIVENSQCRLTAAGSSWGPPLFETKLTLNLSFKPGFSGQKNVYVSATDLTGATTGWVAKGAWTVSTAAPSLSPLVVSRTPDGGSGSSLALTVTFSDPDGWQDLDVLNILVNDFLDGRHACYIAYSRPLNVLYLVNDTGDALLPALALNGTGSVGNSQCTIQGAGTSAVGAGNTLTLVLNLTFNSVFGGRRIVYSAARDLLANNTGWQPMLAWGVGPIPALSPWASAATVYPEYPGSPFTILQLAFGDNDGWQDLDVVNALVNDFLDGRNGCYIAYSRPLNVLYLVNDGGDGLLPALVLNGSGSVGNSQCIIYGAGSSAAGNGVSLILTLKVQFLPALRGNRVAYLAARDLAQHNSGWQALNAWNIP